MEIRLDDLQKKVMLNPHGVPLNCVFLICNFKHISFMKINQNQQKSKVN